VVDETSTCHVVLATAGHEVRVLISTHWRLVAGQVFSVPAHILHRHGQLIGIPSLQQGHGPLLGAQAPRKPHHRFGFLHHALHYNKASQW